MSDLKTQYAAFVAKLFNRTDDLSKDFCHATLGVITEMRELALARDAQDDVTALEEAGDLTFFHTAYCMVVQDLYPEPDVDGHAVSKAIYERALSMSAQDMIDEFSQEMLDAAKRWVGYGKQPTPLQAVELVVKTTIVFNVILMDSMSDVDPEDILRANMAKLLVRYPGGEFDAFRAVTRDTEAERAALAAH